MSATRILIIAKSPAPGRSKTRLSPPCTPVEATALAEAALVDTLGAVRATGLPATLVLDGAPGRWLPSRMPVIRQRGRGLDERLAAAFDDVNERALLIGMDTPQVTSVLLEESVALLETPGVDAVLGPAEDGGWWAIGLERPQAEIFLGVPMSTSFTGAAQLARLQQRDLECELLPALRDVDRWDDATAVAAPAPSGRFGSEVRRVAAAIEARERVRSWAAV